METIEKLKRLKKTIQENKEQILEALKLDLGKPQDEAVLSEYYPVIHELDLFIKNIKKWKKPGKVYSKFNFIGCKTYLYPEPYGRVLIISPWNYPFQLCFLPLIGAVAAGNFVVVKPSEYSENTSRIIKKILEESEVPEIEIYLGGPEVSEQLLNEKYDYIFFTGSTSVGRRVYRKAAENLTPVTLELGGKSPAIIEPDADFKEAVEKILWGKFFNSGQTCIAPDYVYIPETKMVDFLKYTEEYMIKNGGPSGKIIDKKHYMRLEKFLENEQIIYQEELNESEMEKLKFPFTLLLNPASDSKVMNEEIFGPILPLIEYTDLNLVYRELSLKPKPLALYIFRKDRANLDTYSISSGGLCINGTLFHTADRALPFGGVGESGMGKYHGKYTFDTFTHMKPVFEGTNIKIKFINKFGKLAAKFLSEK